MSTLPTPTFATLLRHARRAAGLTQEALAERASISVDAISALERGLTRAPHADTVDFLAKALHLSEGERAAWEQATRGLRLPGEEAAPALDSASQPPAPLPRPAPPTGTVTLLFTDIEGSTRLLHRLGSEYARALGEHQALLRAAFAAHGGVEVDTQGDAFYVAFASAPAAVEAAALAAHAWPEGTTLRVRMGLHTGTPQVVGDHYVGLDVHRAARIAAAGHGGQVLLSQTTHALVEQALPDGMTLRELGAHRLEDLHQPERLYQLVLPGLLANFPPLKTLETHQHNLPIQLTPLLGREEEVTALAALLRREEGRLVTLTGPGGIGKTRLAMQVAAELVDTFADGVWLVRLARLVDPGLVVPTIAHTLGMKEQGSQPLAEMLRAHLADKHLLLVLDNFEQVVGAAPEMAALLEASRGLHVLVTSRLVLHLRGERETPLAPLPLPQRGQRIPPEALSQYAAVALFLERAQAARPDFAVTAANAPAIAEICARLDGLPLALELAASRVKVLPPEALLSRLVRGLHLLTDGGRDADEQQQTMCATIAWSEDLLTPEERRLFRRLAVFVGGCTLETAEVICAAPAGAAPLGLDLLEGLSALIDHSLVQPREEGGEPRFGLLQVIREYALAGLEASGETEALRRAHAAHFLALAEQAEPELSGPEVGTWLGWLEREYDNLRAALGWAREQGEAETGLRLAAAIREFWGMRGHLREGRAWVEGLLALESGDDPRAEGAAHAVDAEVRARALIAGSRLAMGNVAAYQGDLERAAASYAEAVALARQDGDQQGVALGLSNLGAVARMRGEVAQAEALGREALALFRDLGDLRACAGGLEELASTAGVARQGERAARLLGAAAALRETLDAPQAALWQAEVEQEVTASRATLGEEAWVATFAAGRALSLEQALAEALSS
jgi:predicted ATPase/class 3 adenylate cyclase